ncbi:hypothetical protein K458DRAFT_23333 [Lentithecium fluviatile CBS 122367]|uniref:Uncharacterized protein n=1 Tax=Lentithecium fluviatile CBS 122367 TaxID=1168545 RepID=A0A6G1J4L9_9PLEO|nr:hypothetical protein K458DRAFT_23333 [Lentithecium fluviatile CBS 122367]
MCVAAGELHAAQRPRWSVVRALLSGAIYGWASPACPVAVGKRAVGYMYSAIVYVHTRILFLVASSGYFGAYCTTGRQLRLFSNERLWRSGEKHYTDMFDPWIPLTGRAV